MPGLVHCRAGWVFVVACLAYRLMPASLSSPIGIPAEHEDREGKDWEGSQLDKPRQSKGYQCRNRIAQANCASALRSCTQPEAQQDEGEHKYIIMSPQAALQHHKRIPGVKHRTQDHCTRGTFHRTQDRHDQPDIEQMG